MNKPSVLYILAPFLIILLIAACFLPCLMSPYIGGMNYRNLGYMVETEDSSVFFNYIANKLDEERQSDIVRVEHIHNCLLWLISHPNKHLSDKDQKWFSNQLRTWCRQLHEDMMDLAENDSHMSEVKSRLKEMVKTIRSYANES